MLLIVVYLIRVYFPEKKLLYVFLKLDNRSSGLYDFLKKIYLSKELNIEHTFFKGIGSFNSNFFSDN